MWRSKSIQRLCNLSKVTQLVGSTMSHTQNLYFYLFCNTVFPGNVFQLRRKQWTVHYSRWDRSHKAPRRGKPEGRESSCPGGSPFFPAQDLHPHPQQHWENGWDHLPNSGEATTGLLCDLCCSKLSAGSLASKKSGKILWCKLGQNHY